MRGGVWKGRLDAWWHLYLVLEGAHVPCTVSSAQA